MSERERERTEKKPIVEQKSSENFKGAALRWFKALDSPVGFLFITVLTGAAIYFTAIDWRVNRLVNDPDFVAKVARRARPAIVFDADRRLLADSGAYRFLEGVPEVELAVKDKTVKSELGALHLHKNYRSPKSAPCQCADR